MGIVFSTPSDRVVRNLGYALDRVRETPFFVCKMMSGFCEDSSFSQCQFRIEASTNPNDPSKVRAFKFLDLFNVDLKPEGVDGAMKFIHRCKKIFWPCDHWSPNFVESEKTIMIDVCTTILMPLCNEVILERGYQDSLKSVSWSSLTCGAIGLGTPKTWHGTPDGRVRAGGVNLLCSKTDKGDAGSDEESDGMTTGIEGKIRIKLDNLPQLVAMNVVSAFTEHSLHPEMSPMVPSILIGKNRFRVSLYHCEKDILLVSGEVSLSTAGFLSQSAMVLLWAVLNHRRFLVDTLPSERKYEAGIKSRLEQSDKLKHFTALSDKTVDWHSSREALRFAEGTIEFLPPTKKMKVGNLQPGSSGNTLTILIWPGLNNSLESVY